MIQQKPVGGAANKVGPLSAMPPPPGMRKLINNNNRLS